MIINAQAITRSAIYNIDGTIISEGTATVIPVSSLSRGVKIIVVTDSKGHTVTAKVII